MGSLKPKSVLSISGLSPLSVTGITIQLARCPTKPVLLLQSMYPISVRNTSTALQRDPGSLYTTLQTHKANLYCKEGVSAGQEGKGLEAVGRLLEYSLCCLSGHHRAKLTYINDSQSGGHVSSPLCHTGHRLRS